MRKTRISVSTVLVLLAMVAFTAFGTATAFASEQPDAVARLQAAISGLLSYQAEAILTACNEDDECATFTADVATDGERFHASHTAGPEAGSVQDWEAGVTLFTMGSEQRLLEYPLADYLFSETALWPVPPSQDHQLAVAEYAGRQGTSVKWDEDGVAIEVIVDNETGLPLLYAVQIDQDIKITVVEWQSINATGDEVVLGRSEEDNAFKITVKKSGDTWVPAALQETGINLVYNDAVAGAGERLPEAKLLSDYLALRTAGFDYVEQDDQQKALPSFMKAALLAPYLAEAHTFLASTYHNLGQLTQAVAEYEQALMIDPYIASVYNNIAYILAEGGLELEKALQYSAISLELEPDQSSYLDTYGFLLLLAGEFKEGEKELWRALDIETATCTEEADCAESKAIMLSHLALARYRQQDIEMASTLMAEARFWDEKVVIPVSLRREYKAIEAYVPEAKQ